jgi:hypothetical protein
MQAAEPALLLDHIDCDFRAIGFGKPGFVLKAGRDRAVAGFVRVAKFVELEKFRRECFAARVALAFVGIDVNPQSLGHGGILGRMRGPREAARVPHLNLI